MFWALAGSMSDTVGDEEFLVYFNVGASYSLIVTIIQVHFRRFFGCAIVRSIVKQHGTKSKIA
jgi:hypothetical protein